MENLYYSDSLDLTISNTYNKNNWVCRKCNKTAGQLGVSQAQTGYNVPGLKQCFENKPTNHIWKRIK